MQIPSAIIFVNNDLDGYLQATLEKQLFIAESMTDVEFNARVVAIPNYPDIVHLQGLRILVIRETFRDYTNRNLADVVIFVKGGLATILKNNLGPPGLSLPVERLNIYALLRYNNSTSVIIVPSQPSYPFPRIGPGGIVGEELRADDASGVHAANTDNEFNNPDFINRK
jgi:hypothetical protein